MKKLTAISSTALAYLAAAGITFAADQGTQNVSLCPESGSKFGTLCTEATSLGTVISRTIIIILVVAAIIALFFLIWGGIKWILSGGDKGKVEAARNTIIAAIIGLIITFLAFFILSFVFQLFGLGGITDLQFSTFRIFGQ